MPTSQKKPVDCSELAASLAELALAHGEAGVNTLDGVVDAIRRDLPEVDRNTIADAIVAYSARPKPEAVNKSEIKARIAELKRVARRDVELRDQIAALKKKSDAAVSRPKDKKIYDDRVAALEKERDSLQKSITKEKAEDRSAEKISAEIEDLHEQITTGKLKDAPPREKKIYSDRIQSLRNERASLKKEVNAIRAEDRTVEALTAKIDDLTEQIETGAFKSKTPAEKKVYSDRVQVLRGERDALQKSINRSKAEARTEDRIATEIKDLERQVASGEFKSKPPSEKKVYSDKITALQDERAALRKKIADSKAESRSAEKLASDIQDLEEQLSTGNLKDAGPREKKVYSEEIESLRKRRKGLLNQVGAVKSEVRTADKISNEIDDLREQIASGEFKSKPASERKVYSDRITELRNERAALLKEKGDAVGVKKFGERLQDQIASMQDQLRTGDIEAPTPRAKKTYDDHLESLRFQRDKLRKKINQEIQKQQQKTVFKQFVEGPFNEFRALMTTGEFSAVLRQGGFLGFADPVKAAKTIKPMLKAFANEKTAHKIDQEIRSRPNATLYEKSGLHLPDPEIVDSPKNSEEMFQTDLPIISAISKVTHIPIEKSVHPFGRAYITFLNLQRADTFDRMAATLAKEGEPNLKEAKAISNFINVATGRGSLGKAEAAISALNTVFFAPRYVASRFQLLGEPVRAAAAPLVNAGIGKYNKLSGKSIKPWEKGLYGGTRETDKLIAKEYAKYAVAVGTILTMASFIPGVEIEKDPRSTDFGKIRVGNTRLDMFSGLQQAAVFAAKQVSSQNKSTATGEVDDMDARTWLENTTRFGRGKLSPLIGTALDLKLRQDVVGQQVAPLRSGKDAAKFALKLLTPITYQDIYKILTSDYGLDAKGSLSLMAVLGAGIQSYDPGMPQAPDDRFKTPASEREASPQLGSTIHLNDAEYAELLQAHEEGLAEIKKEQDAGTFKGMTQKEVNEGRKAIYDDVFQPVRKGIVADAINRLDP